MSKLAVKNIASPDQTVKMVDKGRLELVNLGAVSVSRLTLEPGWIWREHEQPLFGTNTCELEHSGYCTSGRLRLSMDDGQERELKAGDAFHIPAGHEAEVLGDEPFVALLFEQRGAEAKTAVAIDAAQPTAH